MGKTHLPPDIVRVLRDYERRIKSLELRASRSLQADTAYDNLVNSGNRFDESFLDLSPQFATAGTTNLPITATTTGTAQDTGLSLTAADDGDYLIWSHHNVTPGTSGGITVELRVAGSVISQISLGTIPSNLGTLGGALIGYTTGLSAGGIVKCTAFRTAANGSYLGQNSYLIMLRVGP